MTSSLETRCDPCTSVGGRGAFENDHPAGRRMTKRAARTLIALLIVSGSGAMAAEPDPLEARIIADVGWFFMSTDTRVRLDGETTGSRGTDFDFDDTFGLGDFDRFRVDALWRISGRHAVRAMYFDNDRSATRAIARDIRFGDRTFSVGASVTARSELTVAQLSYDYAFLRRENYEVAAGIGLHAMDLALSLNSAITAPEESASVDFSEEASTTAPLPVLGVRGVWRLPHRFFLTAHAQYFYIELDEYEGSLTDLKAAIVWQPTRHVGIGVGYNDFRFRFDVDDDSFNGRLRWNYSGAVAFASFMF